MLISGINHHRMTFVAVLLISLLQIQCFALLRTKMSMVSVGNDLRKRVVVFGATGRTGREVVKRLSRETDVYCICAVKDMKKGRELFGPDNPNLSLLPCDVKIDSKMKIKDIVATADAVICATGYSPSGILDPLGSYNVDFKGTKKVL